MIRVNVGASFSDSCGVAFWKIIRVRSSEAVNGRGDGNTPEDWRITGDHTLLLRAEHSGTGNGRTYYIDAQATDAAGNQSEIQTVTVAVPKSQGKAGP